MRYEKGHKEAKKLEILREASGQFRKNGIAATGVASVMQGAGLTNGAFFGHFASKDDLVNQSLLLCLDEFQESLVRSSGNEPVDLLEVVRQYLSVKHRDHPEAGCPTAALAGELARTPMKARKKYTTHLINFIDQMVSAEGPLDRDGLLSVFALMIGSLQLARAVSDKALSLQILKSGAEAAETLIRIRTQTS